MKQFINEKSDGSLLRFPAAFFVGLSAIVCIAAIVILLANPNSTDAKEKAESSQIYYGVVKDVNIENFTRRLLLIPGIGEIEIPKAEMYTYFEGDEKELLPGDMVQITFPAGKEVFIQETWPASFSAEAESVVVIWQGSVWENLISVIGVEEKDRYMWQMDEINQLEIEGKECFSLDLRYSDDEARNGVMAGRLFGSYAVSKDGTEFYWYNPADDIREQIVAINP